MNRTLSLTVLACSLAVLAAGLVSNAVPHGALRAQVSGTDMQSTPVYCPVGQGVSWNGSNGVTCDATVSTTVSSPVSGETVTLYDTGSPTTGSATYSCTPDGVWQLVSGSASCVSAAPNYCSGGQYKEWSGSGGAVCSGYTVTTSSVGTAYTVTDSVAPATGYASFLCQTDGVWASSPTTKYCVTTTNTSSSTAINGQCTTTAVNTCSAGTFVDVADDASYYYWYCSGVNGGTGTQCMYPKDTATSSGSTVNGRCGSTNDSCLSGTWEDMTDTSSQYLWACKGSGGGTDTVCGAVRTTTTYPSCSLSATPGLLIDFTKGGSVQDANLVLVAHKNESDATLAVSQALPAGTYRIDVETYQDFGLADFASASSATQQRWLVELVLSDNTMLKSGTTWDLAASESRTQQNIASGITLPVAGKQIIARHAAYPSAAANPVIPLCIHFSPIATATDGVCGTAVNTCRAGTLYDTPDSDAAQLWTCKGSGGGTTIPCSITKQTQTTSSPVVVEPSPIRAPEPPALYDPTLTPTVTVEKPASRQSALPSDWVAVPPDEVGITGVAREIAVPKELVVQRTRITEQSVERPFEFLQTATPRERDVFLAVVASTTATLHNTGSTTPSRTAPSPTFGRSEVVIDDALVAATGTPTGPEQPVDSAITKRAGLIAFRDSDGDGITDYDEEHIYGTDPENPFTSGSALSDGERVVLGLDPHATDTTPVPVESPRTTGAVATHEFTIDSIVFATTTSGPGTSTGSSVHSVRVSGSTQPFAFVTLYIYSTPIIITVRADSAGKFEYTFDTTLEDGTHELYAANVNNGGKILARSEAIPFIKTAQAIEFTPPSVPVDPVQGSMQYMITFGLLAMFLAALGAVGWIGMHRAPHEEPVDDPHNDEHTNL